MPFDLSDIAKVKISTDFARYFKDTTDYDFGLGDATDDTEVSGTGIGASVQLELLSSSAVLTTPVLSATYDTPGQARGVYVSGNYAYVADYTSGLQIIDISTPASLTLTILRALLDDPTRMNPPSDASSTE